MANCVIVHAVSSSYIIIESHFAAEVNVFAQRDVFFFTILLLNNLTLEIYLSSVAVKKYPQACLF